MTEPDPLLARLDAMLDRHGIMGHARRQMDSELRALLADEPLIAEVRRLRALTESQAMDLMVAKTKIAALMGRMNLKEGD